MSKKNLAKRLIALVAIVAMFAAMTITASAAADPQYNSSTVYVNGNTVKVTTYVTGLENGDEVTYYAKNGDDDVYVNQYTAKGQTMTKSYIADAEDVSNLTINMAKVNSSFEEWKDITGIKNDPATVKFVCGDCDWSKQYFDGDILPMVDDIIKLEGFPMINDGKKLSSLTAIVGEKEYSLTIVDELGSVSIVSPIAIQFGADGKYFTTDESEERYQYSAAALEIVLEAEYNGTDAGDSVNFNYIGDNYSDPYTIDDVSGKLFAVAYTITNPGAATEYGIAVNGTHLKAVGASVNKDNTASFAIAVVDPELTTFTYKPYAIVNGNAVYGAEKTAYIY